MLLTRCALCGSIQRSTYYTDANVTTATPVEVYGNQFSVSDPEWVTNSRTLVFGGYGRQVAIDDLGPGEYDSVPWNAYLGEITGQVDVDRDILGTIFGKFCIGK